MTTTTRPMLHCILREPPCASGLPAGMRMLALDHLAALVADVEPDAIRRADSARLTAYADLIAHIHQTETLIPMRFGCVLATDQAILKLLDKHRDRLLALLDHLADCVEFGVRLVLPDPPAPTLAAASPFPPPPQPGTQARPDPDPRPGHGHLAAIRRRLNGEALAVARAQAAKATLERAVPGLFREIREEFGQIGGKSLLSLYFLVPREVSARFITGLQQDQLAIPGTGLVTGPWPPYNFVGAIDDDLRSFT
ncbi:GvpL/GvpF family gas vesicle protein [uncultured Lamprocystis sp.]|jgi:hypothetical protein|uniref:GvpL/GvpF family gas vesicle protein n=1 Tax=uncultured Lamprocystis sp. TaxID=543132 RepID=UPI0025E1C09D|nr:GvpL/GvpF family gas vesicle protein [uncultured Lamprocystis sp.]